MRLKQIQWNQPITETQGSEIIFCCRQVPFHIGIWSLDPRDCKGFLRKVGFLSDQVPFNKANVPIHMVAVFYLGEKESILNSDEAMTFYGILGKRLFPPNICSSV